MVDLDSLVRRYHKVCEDPSKTRYDRLEALAHIYIELENLARDDGFGPTAVTGWSSILSRRNS